MTKFWLVLGQLSSIGLFSLFYCISTLYILIPPQPVNPSTIHHFFLSINIPGVIPGVYPVLPGKKKEHLAVILRTARAVTEGQTRCARVEDTHGASTFSEKGKGRGRIVGEG